MATAKKPASKATAKKPAAKPTAKPAAKATAKPAAKATPTQKPRKPNAASMKEMKPSAALAVIVGNKPLPRTELIKKIWAYIKKHGLQDAKERRNITAEAALAAVFGGKK